MYEFWYDYVQRKYFEIEKFCHIEADSFIVYIKADVIYKDIAEDVKARFDTSNNELDRQLLKRKKCSK